ncbi:protein of unknown function UPF0236 [Caldicellulosiruptor owensensis OL]|uniref:ISLre2 family transposase n=1 Tax=Caldicellulosiruptor owensensis (strain ATCC 700167 / DSM 13100 / OL) TaxID=632518 RepID=E4Q6W1_CALOW|nr:ISLre2-like element ISCow1 family transposase [Caldicellulosiruptor owensensis]ADQ04544.1 protein of unknown function UPF0236 [Caldicellulosiruptor owensensis OL]
MEILRGEKDIAMYSMELKEKMDEIGKEMIKEACGLVDEIVRNEKKRKARYEVVRKDKRSIKTIFGDVEYIRTYYKNKEEGGYVYLADEILGIEKYQRIDKAVKAAIVEKVVEISYEKAAKEVLGEEKMTRQSVMNILRRIEAAQLDRIEHNKKGVAGSKKVVKELYIEADEDHISLQNGEGKIAKLAYINEGYKEEKGIVKRKELKGVHYFSSIKERPEDFWSKVSEYIEEHYETEKIEKIYLLGDGAAWIKEGLEWIVGAEFVLDRFHLMREVIKISGGDKNIFAGIVEALRDKDREKFEGLVAKAMEKAGEDKRALKRINESRRYIANHWDNIVLELDNRIIKGCSAEGHVSHVLADRMSSRPRGWSEQGAEVMVKLLSLKYNGVNLKEAYLKEICGKEEKEEKILKEIVRKNVKKIRKQIEETRNNVPILARGKVDLTFRVLKGLSTGDFLNAVVF